MKWACWFEHPSCPRLKKESCTLLLNSPSHTNMVWQVEKRYWFHKKTEWRKVWEAQMTKVFRWFKIVFFFPSLHSFSMPNHLYATMLSLTHAKLWHDHSMTTWWLCITLSYQSTFFVFFFKTNYEHQIFPFSPLCWSAGSNNPFFLLHFFFLMVGIFLFFL